MIENLTAVETFAAKLMEDEKQIFS